MQTLIKILKILFYIFVALIIIVNVHVLITGATSGDKIPSIGKYAYTTMDSKTMEPTIKKGDLLILRKVVLNEPYQIDDIITFSYKNSYITHRIVEFDGTDIITKGDTVIETDPLTNRYSVFGIVVYQIPFVGNIMDFLKNPIAIVVIMISGFGLMLYESERQKVTID